MNTKTPISILQELMVAHHKPIPSYVESGFGTEFTCVVRAGTISAHGTGTSKKAAKQQAAKNAIEIFQRDNKAVSITVVLPTLTSNATSTISKNYIGELNELSTQKSMAYPAYEFINATAAGEFVFSCTFDNYQTTGTGSNKKASKQDAAKNMLEILHTNNWESTVLREFNKPIDLDVINKEEIIQKFKDLSICLDVIDMKKTVQSENVAADPSIEMEAYESIESLKEKLEEWGICYEVKIFKEVPPIASFIVANSDFTLLGMGRTRNEAIYKVLQSAVRAREYGCDFSTSFPRN